MSKSRRRGGTDAAPTEPGLVPDIDSDNGTGATAVYNSSEPAEDSPGRNDLEEQEEYSGDEDDEYDDDEEPALRYKRLGGNIQALFEKDTASALIASDRFLVLGTHWGHVVIMDFEGNEVKRWRAHSATVNSVSIDLDNEYVASAGDDGRVVICALYSDEIMAADYSRPVKAVALDPMFSRKASRRFVSGGTSGQLIMNEKKWFGKSDTILFTSEGPIQTIQWQDNLIAWACDEGVQVYDTEHNTRISQIARPEGSPRADLFRCRLHWRDTRTLIVGWANCVQVVEMRERVQVAGAGDSGAGPSLFAEITMLFRTDFIICGLTLYRDHFLILSYGDEDLVNSAMAENSDQVPDAQHQQRSRNAPPPELRMINRNIEEVSSDVLALEGFQLLQPNDYGFAYCAARTNTSVQSTPKPDSDAASETRRESSVTSAEADTWFILSPKQLVSVHPRGLKDHVQWLTERDDYHQALLDIEEAYSGEGPWAMYRDQIKEVEYQRIGQSYAQILMDEGNTKEAADVCSRALPHVNTPEAVEVWESWVFAFAEANALQAIVPYIPTEGLRLTNTVYEMVLGLMMATNVPEFKRLIFKWPASLFNAYSVVLAVEDHLEKHSSDEDVEQLKTILAFLYDRLNQPSKSLLYHLELFTEGVLDRVRNENLFGAIRDKAELVMLYDDHTLEGKSDVSLKDRCEAEGVQLLTDNTDAIPSTNVVKQLVNAPAHLHVYLHSLLTKDPHLGAPFADLQVELYAEYNPEKLLNFLRISTYYSFDKALDICEERNLVPEMVFILGRMGDNHRALMLIIERLHDVPKAIEFAKEQNDPELWNDLLMYSRDKPEFILGLLELGGTHINPTKLIRNIPSELSVPGIRRALTNVLHDYHLQVELCTDCKHVLNGDVDVLSDGLRHMQHQGLDIENDQMCLVCQLPLEDLPRGSAVLAFWCGHIFHDKCILHPDVLAKTQMHNSAESSTLSLSSSRRQITVHSRRDQRRMMLQTKLDRSMLIKQYNPVCPVCAEYDQKKVQQTTTGWSQSERRDHLDDPETEAGGSSAEKSELLLPPMQTLQL